MKEQDNTVENTEDTTKAESDYAVALSSLLATKTHYLSISYFQDKFWATLRRIDSVRGYDTIFSGSAETITKAIKKVFDMTKILTSDRRYNGTLKNKIHHRYSTYGC